MARSQSDVDTVIEKLEERVSKMEDVQNSAREYVQGLKDEIKRLTDQAPQSPDSNNYDQWVDRLTQLADKIDADSAAMAIVNGTSASSEDTGGQAA